MTPLELIGAAAIVTVGAILQGSVGFGLAMLAAPLLVLIDPGFVPAPLLTAGLALALLVARREWQAIDFGNVGWVLVGRVPGTILGALVLMVSPERTTNILVGVIVLLAVVVIGSGWNLPRTRPVLIGAGTLSGFTGTTTSIGGPALATVYHDADGAMLRATMSCIFIAGLVITLTALAIVGRFGRSELHLAACIVPGAIVGYAVSSRVAPMLDRGYTRGAVLSLSALAGLSVIVRALLGS